MVHARARESLWEARMEGTIARLRILKTLAVTVAVEEAVHEAFAVEASEEVSAASGEVFEVASVEAAAVVAAARRISDPVGAVAHPAGFAEDVVGAVEAREPPWKPMATAALESQCLQSLIGKELCFLDSLMNSPRFRC